MDVGGEPRNLDLQQYEVTFRENKIGGDVLPELAESDLEKLDIPLGDRKRLLKAIRALKCLTPDFCFASCKMGPGRGTGFATASIDGF